MRVLILLAVFSAPLAAQEVVYYYLQSPQTAPSAPVSSGALATVNAIRARRGLYPFAYDPNLQHQANQNAYTQASRRAMFHPGGSWRDGARGEGVGMSMRPGTFNSCYLYDRRYRYAAAATYQSGGRYYHCLRVR